MKKILSVLMVFVFAASFAFAAGDAIRNATAGGSVTLTVLDATNIVATAYQGTWSDVN